MQNKNRMVEVNTKLAQEIWDELPSNALNALKVLTTEHNLSVANGDLQLLDGRPYKPNAQPSASPKRDHSRKMIADVQYYYVRACLCCAWLGGVSGGARHQTILQVR